MAPLRTADSLASFERLEEFQDRLSPDVARFRFNPGKISALLDLPHPQRLGAH